MPIKTRCSWAESNKLMQSYHDKEWGLPIYDDTKLFEFLILEGAQAGLSWSTIVNKRENYRKAFDNFNPNKISKYNNKKVQELLSNSVIVRNKLKINSAILNAQIFLEIKTEFCSFKNYVWQFVNNKPIKNNFKHISDLPTTTQESDEMSKDLKKRGFKFVGSTICYAFMQSVGMVNDHYKSCFRYKEVDINNKLN